MKFNYEKLLRLAVVIAIIVAVAVITLGTLAIPVVMSLIFSWYWLFLYAGYLLVALFITLYAVNSTDKGKSRNEH